MKVFKYILVTLITLGMTTSPLAQTTQSLKKAVNLEKRQLKKYSNVALHLVRRELHTNEKQYFKGIEVDQDFKHSELQHASDEGAKFIQMIDDSSYTLRELQRHLAKKILDEQRSQQIEITNHVSSMSIEKVDELFGKAIRSGNYSDHFELEYFSAYTESEKKTVFIKLLVNDLAQIKSQMVKRIGLLKRSDLRREFEKTQSILATDLYAKGKEERKQLFITILTIAAAGLASWAIISHTKKRYERKLEKEEEKFKAETEKMLDEYERLTEELRDHHDSEIERLLQEHQDLMSDTQFEYDQRMSELREIFSDRERLREEGYTWQICKVEEQVTVQTCSYDHQTYTGVKKCVSHCLVAPDGTKVGETSLVCTNDSTPLNCSTVNPTDSGSFWGAIDGYDDGYDAGWDDNYYDAYNRAYADLYDTGYDDGRSEGYRDGFNDGYSDGLSQGEYDSDISYDEGYDIGYEDGYYYATGTFY